MVQDVPPATAWDALQSDADAHLCDVRTEPEWQFVGIPDLAGTGKQVVLIPWQTYPSMQVNAEFVGNLRKAGFTEQHHLYFICRTGGRSMAAAQAAAEAGFRHVFNVADGFEGPHNETGQRGQTAGWKAAGLPWRQR